MRIVVFIILAFFLFVPTVFFISVLLKGLGGAKQDEWEGEVADKLFKTKRGESKVEQEYYTVVFRTNKGERKIAVSKEDYHKWNVGDKATKIKGKFGVEKA
jgi:hypothetical protein